MIRIFGDRLPLNNFYFMIKRKNSPDCDECKCTENVNHFIFKCKKHHVIRNQMLKRIKFRWGQFNREKHFNARYFLCGFLVKPQKNKKE